MDHVTDLFSRDKRATATIALFDDLMRAAEPITIAGIAGKDFDADRIYKTAGDLAHYLHTAPGIDEAQRTLGIAVIAWAKREEPSD